MAGSGAKGGLEKAGGERSFASFFLLGEGFAIDIAFVKEVVGYRELTPAVKGLPDFVEAMIELYGMRIPVLKLATILSIEPLSEDAGGQGGRGITVVNIDGRIFGLIVDIEPKLEVFSTCERVKPEKKKGAFSAYIEGDVLYGGTVFHVLKLESLLNDDDKAALFGA